MEKQAKLVVYDPGDKVDVASEGDIPPPRDLVEQMYCSQQIHIPPTFPYILRQYCKAAIRTQPYDLLKWSTAYFRAMAEGDVPPVKQRLEYPPTDIPSGLTPGYLRVILRQLKRKKVVTTELLYNKWGGLCLNHNALKEMLEIGEFTDDEVDILKFVAIAAGHLTDSLKQTMIIICEILTEEPEGGSAMIPFSTFCDLYGFLAKKDCGPPSASEDYDLEYTHEAEEGETTAEYTSKEEEENELQKEKSSKSFAKDIVCDIMEDVDDVINVSSHAKQTTENATGEDSQEDGEQKLSLESAETAVGEELVSGAKESDIGHEELTDTVAGTKQHEQRLTAEVQPDEDQATELNGESGKEIIFSDSRGSAGEAKKSVSVKFKETPTLVDQENTTEVTKDVSVKSRESSSASKLKTKISEEVATETVGEIMNRVGIATEATNAEINAAQFLMKVKSEIKQKKTLTPHRRAKKEQKPRTVHYEVLGIGPPVSDDQIDKVITYLHYWSARQEGMIMPRNINHFLCPSLDPPPPPEFLEAPQARCNCGTENIMVSECPCTTASAN